MCGIGKALCLGLDRNCRSAAVPQAARRALLVLLALASAACARYEALPPAPAIREQIRDAELSVKPANLSGLGEAPVGGTGSGLLVGAGLGAAASLLVVDAGCRPPSSPEACGLGVIIGVAMLPVGLIVGAIIGGASSHSEAEVAQASASLDRAVQEIGFDRLLASALMSRAPPAWQARLADAPNEALTAGEGAPALPPVAHLLFEVTRYSYRVDGRIDPDITLEVEALGRILAGSDMTELYWRLWRYESDAGSYFDLAANDAAGLRRMAEGAAEVLGARIAHDLLSGQAPEILRDSAAPGTAWTVAARYVRQGDEYIQYDSGQFVGQHSATLFPAGRPVAPATALGTSQPQAGALANSTVADPQARFEELYLADRRGFLAALTRYLRKHDVNEINAGNNRLADLKEILVEEHDERGYVVTLAYQYEVGGERISFSGVTFRERFRIAFQDGRVSRIDLLS